MEKMVGMLLGIVLAVAGVSFGVIAISLRIRDLTKTIKQLPDQLAERLAEKLREEEKRKQSKSNFDQQNP